MNDNRLARGVAVATATLAGLGLFFLCLNTVSAHGTTARAADMAASRVWHVDKSLGEGQVGYWKFDEVSGTRTLNSSLLNNPTTLINGATITTSVPAAVTIPDAGSLLLDGVNDAVAVSDTTNLDVPVNSFGVAAWVRRVFTGTHTADLMYDSGTQTHHWFFGFLANDKLTFTTNGAVDYSSTFTVTDSNWHHVAAVVSGTLTNNLTIYLDGVAAPTLSAVITTTPSGPKLIGNKNGSLNTPFSGSIDEVRLYNRPLSAVEVGRLAAGRGCVVDGATWPAAFVDLQCALDVAASGDQIWIAGGTYRPGTNRAVSFRLVNGVSLFGGFDGTETSPAQRPPFDPNAPITALSGDAAGDDVAGSFANRSENTCGVVTAGSSNFPDLISATVDGLMIRNGNANCPGLLGVTSGGGLAGLSAVRLSLNNIVFKSNQANNAGGGLFADRVQLTLNGTQFFSNTANVGGGLAFSGGNVTVTASSFVSNTAVEGGAIDIDVPQGHATLAISTSSFFRNQAADSGGVIYDQIVDGLLDLTLTHDTFTANSNVGGDGGAIDNISLDPGLVRTRLSQSTFTGNVAEVDGGAISDFGGQLSIDGSQFTGNSSPSSTGGALEARSVVTVTNSAFMSNTARSGGAVTVLGTLVMSGSSVILNQGQDPGLASDFRPVGGGVLVSGTALITNTQFFSNTAFVQSFLMANNLAEGGGLAVTGFLLLSGGDFRDNSAEHGGGLHVLGGASIQRSLFQHNLAGSGGGVFADGDLFMFNNRLIDNTAVESLTNEPSQGGGLLLQNGSNGNRVSDNLFLGNTALCVDFGCTPHGSALWVDGFATLVSNNTIVGRGLITASAASVTGTTRLFNNIITSHTVAIETLGGLTFDDYNLFHANTTNITATGVISSLGHSRQADPRFLSPALDNFRLRLDSPAVDAGDNSQVPGFVTTDLAGDPRFIDVPSVPDTGAGSPPVVDIGAYEANGQLFLFLPLIMK